MDEPGIVQKADSRVDRPPGDEVVRESELAVTLLADCFAPRRARK